MRVRTLMNFVVVCGVAVLAGAACGDSEGSSSTESGSSTGSATGSATGSSTGSSTGSATGAATGSATGMPMLLNGCSEETAVNMAGTDMIDITWTNPAQDCLIVDVGTTINWQVSTNFTSHPLRGGESPTDDAASAISMSDQASTTASVTFDTAGEYPYFCTAHTNSMRGVIYVQ